MKRNIDDFNGMSDFIISIITVVAWVLIGAIVTVGYFTIETKGESVILSFVSTIFTIISSLGIAATIGVYFWQKKDNREKDTKNKNEMLNAYLEILMEERRKYRMLFKSFIIMRERLKSGRVKLKIRRRNDIFTFILKNRDRKNTINKYSFHFNENDLTSLKEASLRLINLDINYHKKAKDIIFAYTQLYLRLDNLFIIYANNTTDEVLINNVKLFARKNNFKVNEIYEKAFLSFE